MSLGNNFITGANPLYMYGPNTWYGDKSQGQMFAYNNGKTDNASFISGTQTDGKDGARAGTGIFMGDAGIDTVTLTGGGWIDHGGATDKTKGISGEWFSNNLGDNILVTQGVNIKGDFNKVASTDALQSSGSLPPAQQPKAAIDAGIAKIKKFVKPGETTPVLFATKDDIQKAIAGGAFDGANPDPVGKKYWQGVVNAINMGLLKGDLPKSLDGTQEGVTSDYLMQAQDKGFNFLI